MNLGRRPSALAGNLTVGLVALGWGAVRLWIFHEQQLPLSFVLPLLLAVWTRRRWHLWAMAGTFFLMATVKQVWLLPDDPAVAQYAWPTYVVTLCNILLGGVVIHGILRLRDVMDARAEAIQRQNTELEAQAEELAQQNEEIKAQGEELAQQNEEIESQSEELQRQNEELLETNQRLTSREEILQAIMEGVRGAGGAPRALEQVCARVLAIIGAPAEALAVVERDDATGELVLQAQAAGGADAVWPTRWPRTGSLAGLVLDEDRTAYVDDLLCRPDLALPSAEAGSFRSALAAPIAIAGRSAGVLIVASRSPTHWSQDQFRLLEWAAAQCGLIMEGARWQAELRDRSEAVEAANRAKDQFLATLSHELRTPLSPVLAAAEELAEDTTLSPETRAHLQMIQRNVSIQSRLIDDLLDLTRIARGKIDLNQQPISVPELLRESAAIVAGDLSAKGQTLALDIDLPPACQVVGDAARLQQVFWNLLKNSTKFSPPGGTIHLRAALVPAAEVTAGAARGRRVVIEVVDSGTGIETGDLKRIFLPFEQATALQKRGGSAGLGLGLSIARAITELHDGTIQVRSDGLGTGATFTVELPLAHSTETASLSTARVDGSAIAKERTTSGPSRILLVEDHADTGTTLMRLLRRAGFIVEHVDTVGAAVARWQAEEFHLLISDLGLPDGTGFDLLRTIRAQGEAEVRAICMSGYGMENDLAQSREAGFREHLIKPVSKQKLMAAIQRLVGLAPSGEAAMVTE